MAKSRKRVKYKVHLLLGGKPAATQEIIDAINRRIHEKEINKKETKLLLEPDQPV